MSIEYWVACTRDPLADELPGFGEVVAALRRDRHATLDGIDVDVLATPPRLVAAMSKTPWAFVASACGRPGADWDEGLALLEALAAAGQGVVVDEEHDIIIDRRPPQAPSARPRFVEAPEWARALAARRGLSVVVFVPREPMDPTTELERVGLHALAGRVDDAGFWNDSSFGDVRCESIPRGSFGGWARPANIDEKKFVMAMRFTAALRPNVDWMDALVSAQVLAAATKGRAFAFVGDQAEPLPEP